MPLSSPGSRPIGAKSSPAEPAGSLGAGSPAREHAIAVACRGKAGIVARDERETGERALLNLGHTFGHALEAACGFSDRLLHGEAVAAGMALAFAFSARQGLLPQAEAARAMRHLADVGLADADRATSPARGPVVDQLMELIAQDKKVKRGMLTFILVRGIGRPSSRPASMPARCVRFSARSLRSDDCPRLADRSGGRDLSADFGVLLGERDGADGVVARRHGAAGKAGQPRRRHRQPADGDARAPARRHSVRQQLHQYRGLHFGDRADARLFRQCRRDLRRVS